MTFIISDGQVSVEVNSMDNAIDTVSEWYDYLNDDRDEHLTWSDPGEITSVDELNEYIYTIENEIAQQFGHNDFHGQGNYSCAASCQMGLNLTVVVVK
jgi:hypothetical protein